MESAIQDYRTINGVNIAHAGRTAVSLFRFGENEEGKTRTRMEEVWSIEEVDFNIKGLSMDCFLPPSDLKKEDETPAAKIGNRLPAMKLRQGSGKSSSGKGVKIVAIDEDDLGRNEDHE